MSSSSEMSSDCFDAIVEISAGSRNKYEFDEKSGRLRLDRQLPMNMVYPADYGFVPETLAEDGDPVDVLILIDEPAVPGSVVNVFPLGVLRVRDEHGPDPKVICVLADQASREGLTDIGDLSGRVLAGFEHFFTVYKDLEEQKWAETSGFGPRADALVEISEGRRRWSAKRDEAR
ncbi:MAG: inorganic diphosphatase [Acidimicrobiales bacterium]